MSRPFPSRFINNTNTSTSNSRVLCLYLVALVALLLCVVLENHQHCSQVLAASRVKARDDPYLKILEEATTVTDDNLGCIAFNPYVQGYNEKTGPHPPPELIETLMDRLVTQTKFRCISIYHYSNGLDHVFPVARKLGVRIISIIWLEPPPFDNVPVIEQGIQLARDFPDVLIGLSCGSEFTLRNPKDVAERIILDCIDRFRNASLNQPLTSHELATNYCEWNDAGCSQTSVAQKLDYLSINIFPWWGNKYGGCFIAEQAPGQHMGEYMMIRNAYADKHIVISENGWPAGPYGFSYRDNCGIASELDQDIAIVESLKMYRQNGMASIIFEFAREPWKKEYESVEAEFWGICEEYPPYNCKAIHLMLEEGGMMTRAQCASSQSICSGECFDPKYYYCQGGATLRIIPHEVDPPVVIPSPSPSPSPLPTLPPPEPSPTLSPSPFPSPSVSPSPSPEPIPSPSPSPSPFPLPSPSPSPFTPIPRASSSKHEPPASHKSNSNNNTMIQGVFLSYVTALAVIILAVLSLL